MDAAKTLKLLKSDSLEVSNRAALLVLKTHEEYPISTIIEILKTKYNHGLGAKTSNVLIERSEDVSTQTLKNLLKFNSAFAREVGCKLAGKKKCNDVFDLIVKCLRGRHKPICWAAIFALRDIGGIESIKALEHAEKTHSDRNEINFEFRIQGALKDLKASS